MPRTPVDFDSWPESILADPEILRCLKDNGFNVRRKAEVIKGLNKLRDTPLMDLCNEVSQRQRGVDFWEPSRRRLPR